MAAASELFDAVETARLRLRPPRLEDAAALSAMMSPEISRGLGAWPIPFTPQMAAERIEGMRRLFVEGAALPCVVERRSDDTVLGWIAAVGRSDGADRAVLSYWLGEEHQRQGYMLEAAPVAIGLAFRHLDVAAIEASTHPENAASSRVLLACGLTFIEERMIFAPARSREERCLVYGLSRSDHENRADLSEEAGIR